MKEGGCLLVERLPKERLSSPSLEHIHWSVGTAATREVKE